MYSKLLLIATTIVFAITAALAEDPSPKKEQAVELAPTIKGLSVGMDFSGLKQWFAEKLKDTTLGYEVLPEGDATVFLIFRADLLDLIYL